MRRSLVFGIVVVAVSVGTSWAVARASRATARPAPARAAAPRPTPRPWVRPRVTVIGDSVADELSYIASAQTLLGRGVRLNLQLAACRRLVEPSCTVAGVQPTTALELVHALGRSLGPIVVVSVGYNDYEQLYPGDVLHVLTALRQAGVQRVLWLTLRAERHSYLAMNDALRQIAVNDPQFTLVDWNAYSRSHPSWFDDDGLHLTPAGAIGLARLVHGALVGIRAA